MITVTLGTIPYPFQRAIDWLDTLLKSEVIQEPIFLQSGITDTRAIVDHPLVTIVDFVEQKKLEEIVGQSRLVISHAGQGSTRMLASQKASFILLPRLKKHNEHIDDHQLYFAKSVGHYGIQYCLELNEVKNAIISPPPCFEGRLFSDLALTEYLMKTYSNKNLTYANPHPLFRIKDNVKSAS